MDYLLIGCLFFLVDNAAGLFYYYSIPDENNPSIWQQ